MWKRLEFEPLLAGWYLIGGTALALRIGHRRSEDLDFAWPGEIKLPAATLAALIRLLESEGWKLTRDDDAKAYDEFLIAGMSLHDYQQNFIASGNEGMVKLTFFSPEGPLARLLPRSNANTVAVPELPLLFKAKALVTAQRSASRDWLDLYVLMTKHGFTMEDYAAAFEATGSEAQLDLALQRLYSGEPRSGDPGYEALIQSPPPVNVMAGFFREEWNRWKLERADRAWQDRK
ncbi:MAG TPA: nucleotidyl transferase AbiEii/AbiGii toxin family protein [Verrucomicrobiales bacterium]|jgi:hypothetical protein|nr:nucleotidyl transferase AbiEii/AbiGii toxin family protein [Verrucomicrobiales bacterium]